MKQPHTPGQPGQLIHGTWRAMMSFRLSLVQLGLLCLAMLCASLLPQLPTADRLDPTLRAQWLAQQQFGPATGLMDRLSLFDVAHSWWLRLLIAWTAVSLAIYILARAATLRLLLNHRHRSTSAPRSALLTGETVDALHRLGYRTRMVEREGITSIIATKHALSRLCPLLIHVGVLGVIVSALAGHLTGYRDERFMIVEGDTMAVGHASGLSVRADNLSMSRDSATGVVTDYIAGITLHRDGRVVREHFPLRVNHPLSYDGTSFHLSFYGPAARLRLQDAAGRQILEQGVPLSTRDSEGRPSGYVLADGYRIWLVDLASGSMQAVVQRLDDPARRLDRQATLEYSQPVTVGGLTLSLLGQGRFVGLVVTRDPAAPFVWAFGALVVLATLYGFYFPYRRVLVRTCPTGLSWSFSPSRSLGRREEQERVTAALTGLHWKGGARAIAASGREVLTDV